MAYLSRKIEKSIHTGTLDTRVVILNGARQGGKSAILQSLKRGREYVIERRLDNPAELASARHDPESFVRHAGVMFIDEVQRAPIERDVTQVADLSRRGDLNRLIRLVASRMACTLNVSGLATDSAVPATTLERDLALFEEVFLIKRLEAWTSSETSRALRMRKLLFVDTGLGGYLAGRTAAKVAREPALSGQLLENFALSELARQLGWATEPARLYHYRNRDGREVDGVLEANDGRIVGIQVKSSATITSDDFRHLEHLMGAVPTRFHCGIVLYTGTKILPFGPRLLAAPLDALWRS